MDDVRPRIHPSWPVLATVGGLALLFIGEQILSGFEAERYILAGAGAIAVLAAAVVRLGDMSRGAPGDVRVRKRLALSTLAVVVALALYGVRAYVLTGDDHEKLRELLAVGWPILLACGVAPLVSMEVATLAAARATSYEHRRLDRAFERGLGMALLVACVFVANFLFDRHDVKVDLSTGKKAEATAPTRRMVRELTQPVQVVLFFPGANEVSEALQQYFGSLDSDQLDIKVIDQALAGKTASEAGVNENGYVAVSSGKVHEKIRLGTNLRGARSALRSFDSNFAKALVKVTREKLIAYFTAGHGERSTSPGGDDKRAALRMLKQQLKANRYDVRELGVAEGLAHDIPRDASIVFIMGPEKPFLPEEVAALERAMLRGTRILVALEGEREGDPLEGLLAKVGLKFDKTLLVNDRAFVRVTRTKADQMFIYSNRYSSHSSVTTMTRHSNKLATLFARTGSIEKLPVTPRGFRVDMVLTALDATYADANGDLKFQDGQETRKAFGLAAAVTRTGTTTTDKQTRVFVVSDVDVFTDEYVKFQGNPYLLGDIVYWLRDAKEPVLPTVSEADVRIVHRRDEDAWWFWSTTFGLPAVVAGVGLVVAGRRRRSS